MVDGTKSPDVTLSPTLDTLLGNVEVDGILRTRRQTIDAHGTQLVASGPVADALDALQTRIENAEVGINKTPYTIRVRATGNVNLASALVNGAVINGVTLATGDIFFAGSQSAGSTITYQRGNTNSPANGLYTVVASGAASRSTFADTAAELARIGFSLKEGTVGAGEQWTLALDAADINLGVTPLPFSPSGEQPDFAAELVAARDGETDLSARFERTDDEWYEADRFLEAIAGNAPTPRSFGSSTNLADFTTLTGAAISRLEAIYGWMLGDAAFVNQAYPLNFNAVAALAASATQYYGPGQASTTQGRAIFVSNRAGVVRKLYAAVDVAPGSGKNIVCTLVKNGVDTALTCTISGTGKTASDIVHDVTVAAGDLLELKAVSDSGATTNNALSATLSLGV